MASSGRISVLVSKELQTLLSAIREMPSEVNTAIRAQTRAAALPIWQEAVRGNVTTRLETRVLSDTARVAVTDSNVLLKSAAIGTVSSGTPNALLAYAAEFGADPNAQIATHSAKGTAYTRRRGAQFKLPRSGGYVVYPAAKTTIPRFASLWVQTAIRAIHEKFEQGGAK